MFRDARLGDLAFGGFVFRDSAEGLESIFWVRRPELKTTRTTETDLVDAPTCGFGLAFSLGFRV